MITLALITESHPETSNDIAEPGSLRTIQFNSSIKTVGSEKYLVSEFMGINLIAGFGFSVEPISTGIIPPIRYLEQMTFIT